MAALERSLAAAKKPVATESRAAPEEKKPKRTRGGRS
jgi:hypothetical protein